MEPHRPAVNDCRITVLVQWTELQDDEARAQVYPYRRVLHPGYEVAVLNMREQDRLRSYGINASWRLEIFNQVETCNLDAWGRDDHRQVYDVVAATFAKLSLCVRGDFSSEYIVVDVFTGSQWERLTPVFAAGIASQNPIFGIPEERLDTWGDLIKNWPARPDAALTLAMEYYCESLAHRRARKLASATVSAAIATEILFGNRGSEISYRISVRVAQLLAKGEDAVLVQRAVSKLYGLRSGVVHSGKSVKKQDVDLWHQLLMRAIPTVAAWGGSVDSLRSLLDEASFNRTDELDRLQDPEMWWNFCDFGECLAKSAWGASPRETTRTTAQRDR